MNETQWETAARALAAAHANRTAPSDVAAFEPLGVSWPRPADLRQALIELDQLLRPAPVDIQQRYKAIDESFLRALADEAQGSFDEGSLAWLDRDPVEAAAAQIRALDRYLYTHREVRGKPVDANTDYLCPVTKVHAIPRPRAVQPAAKAIGTPTFRRRGLVWHRLIPQEIQGYTIDLFWFPDLSLSFRRPKAKVLGALFDDLSLVPDPTFAKFVASAAPCPDEDGDLERQVAGAYAGDIKIAVWPELTMPLERRRKLSKRLKAQAQTAAPGQGPNIVAAGSWHEVHGDGVRNRLHILSAVGRKRFHHDKSLPLESATLGIEELHPSYRISILIAEDALIAFAICRDFCEAQITRVYVELDVDLVAVPSYGDRKTILAHRQQAHDLAVNPGTRTFVVQQVVPQEVVSSGAGYLLVPEADTASLTPEDMVAASPFATHALSFKKV